MRSFKLHIMAILGCFLLASAGQAAFTINELDSDTPTNPVNDNLEFVELKGNVSEAPTGLTLVFWNGNGGVPYYAIDLTSTMTANAQGLLLIGNPDVIPTPLVTFPLNTLQNGEDAVGLYSGTNAAAFWSAGTGAVAGILVGTLPAGATTVDLVSYETGADTDYAWPAGTPKVDENTGGLGTSLAVGRFPDGNGAWSAQPSTPGAPNPGQVPAVNPATAMDFGTSNTAITTTRSLTIQNNSASPFTVNSITLDAQTSSVFTVIAEPTWPVVLNATQSTSVTVQYANADVSVTRQFGGKINYDTTAANSPDGSVDISALFIKPVAGVVGAVVINEVCYDPNGPSGITDYNVDGVLDASGDEYVELFNKTGAAIDLSGWEVRTGTNQRIIPLGTTLAANGYVVFFSGGTPTGFTVPAISLGMGYANGGTSIALFDGTKNVDAVEYNGDSGVIEETPDTDGYTNLGGKADGGSFNRIPNGSATWMTVVAKWATPGAQNTEPSAAHDWQLFE